MTETYEQMRARGVQYIAFDASRGAHVEMTMRRWLPTRAYPFDWSWIKCAHCEALGWLIVQMYRRGLLRDRAEGCSIRWRNVFRNLRWPVGLKCLIRGDYLGRGRRVEA